MREIRTEITINAAIEDVWACLMQLEHWEAWNPIVKRASGTPAPNSILDITMVGKDGRDGKDGPNYQPVVIEFNAPHQFRWRAKMMASFLFTNDKIFQLETCEQGTRLIHIEAYKGLMVSMFWAKLAEFVPGMLNSMNEALKATLEGQ